ncbi:YqiJ family protein [Rubripirellula amarantea]|nr:YqiJ family protein [Rubripirellula amarantea]
MNEALDFIADQMFVGPLWPASIVVGILVLYTVMAMFGLIDFGLDAPDLDAPDLDVGTGIDLDASLDLDTDVAVNVPDGVPTDWDFWQGIGAASVRVTNFGRVPVIIWAGVFACAFWIVSYLLWHGFDSKRYDPNFLPSLLLTIRNGVIATFLTKVITQPLLGYFVAGPSYHAGNLVGATCEISTLEATPEFGQAKFRTQAAPLLLNIRTDGPHLPKGTEALIIGFDREKRIYKVTSLPSESSS